MKKRGTSFSIGAIIPIIIGLVVIASVGTILYTQRGQIGEKIFGEESILPGGPEDKEGFVPYEIELSVTEKQVLDSMNALVCALNSVAIGEFRPDDTSVCPRGLPGQSPVQKEETPTGGSFLPIGQVVYDAINQVTGASVAGRVAQFGDVSVSCEGTASKTIYLASKNNARIDSWQDDFDYRSDAEEYAIEQVGDFLIDCWDKNVKKSAGRYKCGVLASYTLLGKDRYDEYDQITFDRDDILEYLAGLAKRGHHKETIDYLDGNTVTNRVFIESTVSPADSCYDGDKEIDKICGKITRPKYDDAYCVYFKKNSWAEVDTITLTDCQRNIEAEENFVCTVDGFVLPQDVGYIDPLTGFPKEAALKGIIGATGDPKWLVSYEAFPADATVFWRKNFLSEVFSLKAATTVLLSGALNFGFAKGGQIAGKLGTVISKSGKGVEKAAVKLTAEVADSAGRNIAKELAEEGGEVIVNRIVKNGGENMIRSIMIEESLQTLHGIGPKISKKIADRILTVVGKSSGESFELVEKQVQEAIEDVVQQEVKQMPEEFVSRWMVREGYRAGEETAMIDALDEYRSVLSRQIMDDLEIGGQKGVRGVMENKLASTVVEATLKRQSAERFAATLIEKGGKVNLELLEETAETGLKRVGMLNKLSNAYSDRLLKSSRSLVDEMLRGTIGGKKGVQAAGIIKKSLVKENLGMASRGRGVLKGSWVLLAENMPVKFAKGKWLVTGPHGYATATIGKTTANLPAWVAKHRYPMLVLLGAFMLMEDSANEQIMPVGGNALSLNTPVVYGPSQRFELHPDALKFFIRNKEKPGDRLYLVSPCKTKLTVKQKKCECINNPMMNKFNFENTGLINVKPGSLIPKDEAVLRDIIKDEFMELVKMSPDGLNAELMTTQDTRYTAIIDNVWDARVFMDAYVKAVSQGKSKDEAVASAKKVWKSKYAMDYDGEPDYDIPPDAVKALLEVYEREEPPSIEAALLEMVVEDRLGEIYSFYDNRIKDSSLGTEDREITAFGFGGVERTRESTYFLFEPFQKYFDTTNLIKECGSRGITDGFMQIVSHDIAWWGEVIQGSKLSTASSKMAKEKNYFNYASFHVGCLEITPSETAYYCYDDYPLQAAAKAAVHITALVIDVVISVGSGGTAAPAVFFLTGAAAGAADVLIGATEYWPLSTRQFMP